MSSSIDPTIAGKIKKDNVKAAFYKGMSFDNEYTYVPGRIMIPLAVGPGVTSSPPVRVIQVHKPYWMRTVTWDETKKEGPPVIPAPVGNDQFSLVGASLSLPLPQVSMSQNSFNWQASGQYTYVETEDRVYTDGFPTGNFPFLVPPFINALGSIIGGIGVAAAQISFDDPFYRYVDARHYPGQFFDHTMILGESTSITSLEV